MVTNLPLYISIVFVLTTVATLSLFGWTISKSDLPATRQSAVKIVLGLIGWLIVQAVLTLQDVYSSDTTSLPPKIVVFGIFPAVLMIIALFVTKKGRVFLDSLPLVGITYINIIRIPVELVLLWLFQHKMVPELMTFEGRNFDIISGLTAPFIAYFGISRGRPGGRIVLIWNLICLGLLLNIVINALLSAPFPLQQFAFDQPNVAILYFPFSWLPTFIVPIVLFGHLVSIRRLLK